MSKRPSPKTTKKKTFAELAAAGDYSSDASLAGKLPDDILSEYEVHQWKHAAAILCTDFPSELADIVAVLRGLRLPHKHILEGGGGKTKIAQWIDTEFSARGWQEKRWDTKIVIDQVELASPTHAVDCYKNKVALELEWSNKDPFYDRDLNNFRLLFDLRAISVGVIVTKSNELVPLFNDIGVGEKYGSSTTWMSKLLPRIQGGGGGGCPLLVFGIRRSRYVKG
jgi:hypothetical protein